MSEGGGAMGGGVVPGLGVASSYCGCGLPATDLFQGHFPAGGGRAEAPTSVGHRESQAAGADNLRGQLPQADS